jgi:hypothetical protein
MWGGNGKNGGDGGNGAPAIIAEEVTVGLYDSTLKDNITFTRGVGGSGGAGGIALSMIGTSGSLLYNDGEPGSNGLDADWAVSGNVNYMFQVGK